MFDQWIGREETFSETIHPKRLAEAAAMLGLGAEGAAALAAEGAALPPLFHLFFTNNISDAGALNPDGHERLGEFMPPVHERGPFERRMWAAGDIRFDGVIRSGERLNRTSTIRSIEEKQGSTGPLIFVTVERLLETASGRITETRTIVYREQPKIDPAATPADSQPLAGQDDLSPVSRWLPDHIQLFRFSALTWNGHRIHYDADHCRRHEGYPDLITHGPFTAMMLALVATGAWGSGGATSPGLEAARRLERFRFRGTQPLFVGREVGLLASPDFTRLEARNHEGQQAMKADATFG
ncbi:MAG: FAS1-like dehydratase domain-containing protein [Candidatus Puniceispirillales bacterium]